SLDVKPLNHLAFGGGTLAQPPEISIGQGLVLELGSLVGEAGRVGGKTFVLDVEVNPLVDRHAVSPRGLQPMFRYLRVPLRASDAVAPVPEGAHVGDQASQFEAYPYLVTVDFGDLPEYRFRSPAPG